MKSESFTVDCGSEKPGPLVGDQSAEEQMMCAEFKIAPRPSDVTRLCRPGRSRTTGEANPSAHR